MFKLLIAMLFCLIQCAPYLGYTQKGWDIVEKANEQYKKNNLNEALQLYNKALQNASDASLIRYNKANTLFKLGRWQESAAEYLQVQKISNRKTLTNNAHYNLGLCYARLRNWTAAAEAFKKVLIANAKDDEARDNLQLVLNHLKKTNDNRKQPPKKQQHTPENSRQNNAPSAIDKALQQLEEDEKKLREMLNHKNKQISNGKDW